MIVDEGSASVEHVVERVVKQPNAVVRTIEKD